MRFYWHNFINGTALIPIFLLLLVGCNSANITELTQTTCPQINVTMQNHTWGFSIDDTEYEGWSIKGDATCWKGKNEGENINYYYCGGYKSMMGIGVVNGYIQKQEVSETGEIGPMRKYVICNIYDANKKFLQTQCLGDPDEFERKQAEALRKEMLEWQ